jgi:hypothetical protein
MPDDMKDVFKASCACGVAGRAGVGLGAAGRLTVLGRGADRPGAAGRVGAGFLGGDGRSSAAPPRPTIKPTQARAKKKRVIFIPSSTFLNCGSMAVPSASASSGWITHLMAQHSDQPANETSLLLRCLKRRASSG